jgi:hypothetical protein
MVWDFWREASMTVGGLLYHGANGHLALRAAPHFHTLTFLPVNPPGFEVSDKPDRHVKTRMKLYKSERHLVFKVHQFLHLSLFILGNFKNFLLSQTNQLHNYLLN